MADASLILESTLSDGGLVLDTSRILGSAITLSHPLWLIILPLPIIIYWLIPAYRTKQSAIKVPFFDVLVKAIGEAPTEGASQLTPNYWQRIILVLSWVLVVFAMTKPTILGEPQTRENLGRDIMVVVDLSGSMAEADFASLQKPSLSRSNAEPVKSDMISRLDAAKEVLADFAQTRKGDRLGLILFGDAAFVQTPFTADQEVWLELLNQTDVAMAGQSTHLGDAIGLAIKVFEENRQGSSSIGNRKNKNKTNSKQAELFPEVEKVVIVLTDGNDTGSYVEPIDAAKVAAAKGVRIHMIAMGDPATVGEQALDMEIIERVAKESGGEAFQAIDRSALDNAYQAIGELEPQLYESTTYRPKKSIHQYPIMLVVCLYLMAFGLATLRRYRTRQHSQIRTEEKAATETAQVGSTQAGSKQSAEMGESHV